MSRVIQPIDEVYSKIELISATRLIDESKFTVDQMPLLAARVSSAREGKTGLDQKADDDLMSFLATNHHMTPFEHQSATLRVVAPIFVFREWHRHRTQSYNEMSMRYTSDPVGKFYRPKVWRAQSKTNRQGGDGILTEFDVIPDNASLDVAELANEIGSMRKIEIANAAQTKAYRQAVKSYNILVELGIERGEARAVVPVGNYSEMYATANLRNWHGFWKLRSDRAALWEIRQYANAVDDILSELWPRSWSVLKRYG